MVVFADIVFIRTDPIDGAIKQRKGRILPVIGQLTKEKRAEDIHVGCVIEIVDLLEGIVIVSGGHAGMTRMSEIVVVVDTVHRIDEGYRFAKDLFG